jgi:glycine cleavage system aminomethyltransferase T
MAELPPFVPAITYDGDVCEFRKFGPYLAPNEFEGWRQEVRSWKDGAYLGSTLCLSPTYRLTGPDARRFLSDHLVNDFGNLKVGGSRHGLMCDDHAALGTEVTVVWGNPGTRQMPIRATVTRFPYLTGERNEAIDVSALPR